MPGWRLSDLDRDPVKINKTKDILEHLERCIQNDEPFSLVRFGDAGLGIMAALLSNEDIDFGRKWGGRKGIITANSLLNQITIPNPDRIPILKRCVQAANNADYVDSYDSDLIGKFPVGFLAFRWKEIHEAIGITNTNYCSTMFHNFINVRDEYNILDIMKGRKVFCVNNIVDGLVTVLEPACGEFGFYRIPARGKKGKHYQEHFKPLCKLLAKNSKNYDLFLIGAGLLASIYCDVVKSHGGRAVDVGTLFYLWNGMKVKSRASRFLINSAKVLPCRRTKNPPKGAEGIW